MREAQRLRRLALRYLDLHHTMILSTASGSSPWATPLFYANDGFILYFVSDPSTLHAANIACNPNVAVAITENHRDHRRIRGVQLEGTAELLSSPEDLERALKLYIKKFPSPSVARYLRSMEILPSELKAYLEAFLASSAPSSPLRASKARFYRIVPRRLWYTDNRRRLHKKEVPIDDKGGDLRS